MRWIALTALLMPGLAVAAGPHVGDVYQVQMVRESANQGSDGSSGSTHDVDTIIERVLAVRDDGLELEYDLPLDATQEDRDGVWQFPARVFKPAEGPTLLLNATELEARLNTWLANAEWTREVCGHWIFTWNAFQIECDPQSVIETIGAFTLAPGSLAEGMSYTDRAASGSAPLSTKNAGPDGSVFIVELPVDSQKVRQASVATDLVVAEITGNPLTRDEAVRAHAAEDISGTIAVTLETDANGAVIRRTKVAKTKVVQRDGVIETRTATETLDRRLITQAQPSTEGLETGFPPAQE